VEQKGKGSFRDRTATKRTSMSFWLGLDREGRHSKEGDSDVGKKWQSGDKALSDDRKKERKK